MTQSRPNAFTAPATIRWARHEHAQITRNTGCATNSISITPRLAHWRSAAHAAPYWSHAKACSTGLTER